MLKHVENRLEPPVLTGFNPPRHRIYPVVAQGVTLAAWRNEFRGYSSKHDKSSWHETWFGLYSPILSCGEIYSVPKI